MATPRRDAPAAAAARDTLGEAVVTRGAAVAPSAGDSRLAAAKTPSNPTSQPCALTCVTGAASRSPALARQAVAVGSGGVSDASRRAFAAVAAQQGVVAEGLSLARLAGRPHRLGGADALPRHLVAQAPAAALARCRRRERGGVCSSTGGGEEGGQEEEEGGAHVCSGGSRSVPLHTCCTDGR